MEKKQGFRLRWKFKKILLTHATWKKDEAVNLMARKPSDIFHNMFVYVLRKVTARLKNSICT